MVKLINLRSESWKNLPALGSIKEFLLSTIVFCRFTLVEELHRLGSFGGRCFTLFIAFSIFRSRVEEAVEDLDGSGINTDATVFDFFCLFLFRLALLKA